MRASRSTKNDNPGIFTLIFLFLGAILLVPLLIGLGRGLVWVESLYGRLDGLGRENPVVFFGIGFLLFLILYVSVRIPVLWYILGHELTHGVMGWLMGAKVWGLRVKQETGSVRISHRNAWVLLSPYFVPLYLLLFLGVCGLLSLRWGWVGTVWGCVIAVASGLLWGFHFCFTVNNLVQRQTDLEPYGVFFSMIWIAVMNVLVLVCVDVALTPLGCGLAWEVCSETVIETYRWFWDLLWGRIA